MAGRNSISVFFPEDILNEILLRLPVRSLLRFKSVCKQWHGIISNPSFASHHFDHESNPTRLLVHWSELVPPSERSSEDDRVLGVSLYTDERLIEKNHDMPDQLKLPWSVKNIGGRCKGIFCIQGLGSRRSTLALWNPATRRLRPIPDPPTPFHGVGDYGFGSDPSTGELKIVMISGTHKLLPHYAIYTSRNDSWRFFEKEPLLEHRKARLVGKPSTVAIFLDGFCYWLAYDKANEPCRYTIFAFDMRNEVFEEIRVPRNSVVENLGVCHNIGSLALFSYYYYRYVIDIWIMKERGRWMYLSNVQLPMASNEIMHPFGFWKSDQVLVCSRKFISVSGQKRKKRDPSPELMIRELNVPYGISLRLKMRGEGACYERIQTSYYKESLTSVEEGQPGLEDYDIHTIESNESFLSEENAHDNTSFGLRSRNGTGIVLEI